MSVSVKNVQTEELDFGDIAGKLEKAYPFLKLDQTDRRRIKELTPTHTRRVQFEVTASTALANGWRRTMLDEIEWPRFTCSMQDDIRTDDAFNSRLTDYIQNRLNLIPTSYLASPESGTLDTDEDKLTPVQLQPEGLAAGGDADADGGLRQDKHARLHPKYKIDVKNTTQQNMIVRSSDIEHVSGPKITWDRNIDICNLMPGRFIRVQIGLEWGINRTHATFSNFHGVLYRPLSVPDGKSSKELDYEKMPPSYSVHPDRYRLGLTCEEFVDPRVSAKLGWQTLAAKLQTAATRIQEFAERIRERKEHAMPYLTDYLTVTQIRGGVIRYEFKGETLTLTNIIAWYAYDADRSVSYLQVGDDHPEDASSLIRIVHKDHARVLEQAAVKAAKDCETLVKAF
jgi:DNA-directed RNA polymerase subunit L